MPDGPRAVGQIGLLPAATVVGFLPLPLIPTRRLVSPPYSPLPTLFHHLRLKDQDGREPCQLWQDARLQGVSHPDQLAISGDQRGVAVGDRAGSVRKSGQS